MPDVFVQCHMYEAGVRNLFPTKKCIVLNCQAAKAEEPKAAEPKVAEAEDHVAEILCMTQTTYRRRRGHPFYVTSFCPQIVSMPLQT